VTDPAQSELIARARSGDRKALEELVRTTKDLVYNLAIRMLGNPADAEDATQESLMKIVTNLSSFRGESSFRTWAYRVASNTLLTTRKRGAEMRATSFEELGERLETNLAAGDPAADDQLVVLEAKRICTSTMLACLDRDHRLAFILGEILELPGEEAAAVLEIEPDAYRKRVSRARTRMAEFMNKTCGLLNEASACRCAKQAGHAIAAGYLDPKRLTWACHPAEPATARARVDDINEIQRAVEVLRTHPSYVAPAGIVDGVREVLAATSSDLLD
jgi:RNA polymerase sigma factor (sigma-70 family)